MSRRLRCSLIRFVLQSVYNLGLPQYPNCAAGVPPPHPPCPTTLSRAQTCHPDSQLAHEVRGTISIVTQLRGRRQRPRPPHTGPASSSHSFPTHCPLPEPEPARKAQKSLESSGSSNAQGADWSQKTRGQDLRRNPWNIPDPAAALSSVIG